MASITIRNLEERLEALLQVRAAQHNCSMEEEVYDILRSVLTQEYQPARNLGQVIHQRFASFGGVELPKMEKYPLRNPPSFD